MYGKILVPLDGSNLSENVLPYVRALAQALKIQVELLHAIDPEVISALVDPSSGRYADVVEVDMRRKGLEYLEPVAGSFPEARAVSCSTVVDKPAAAIVQIAAATSETLVAMATHGRSGIQRWLLGSVANTVIYTTTRPLLLLRSSQRLERRRVALLKKVIIPLDGSLLAEQVLPHVVALAKKMDMEVLLLQVYGLPPSVRHGSEGYVPDQGQLVKRMKEDAQAYLDQVLGGLQLEGLSRISTLALEGEAAGHIIDIARKTPNSLVAMCTHGRSGMVRLMLGSVTDRVVRHSGNPVLVIRAPSERQVTAHPLRVWP